MKKRQGTALALQGGGVHGAYAWGVLDRLLEDGLDIGRVCGVSSGALLGTMLVQGMVKGGPEGARHEMRRLWARISLAHGLSPLQSGPLERWLFGWDLSHSMAWQGMETALRLFSPSQLNPFGHNPLRAIVDDLLDRDALRHPTAIALTVAATDVETARSTHWTNAEITVDVLLASCCLPLMVSAVQVGQRHYWDGGYSGNPPLGPLLSHGLPERLVLIRAQTVARSGTPSTPADIMNRMNEIACHGVLEAELAAMPKSVALSVFEADAVLAPLPISSKVNADDAFLEKLFAAGRAAPEHRQMTVPEAQAAAD